MARPKKYVVKLSDDEVKRLRNLLKKKGITDTICNRCRILLDVDENHAPVKNQSDCAASHGISKTTVYNTVMTYNKEGIDAVLKLKRSVNSDNARRKVDGRAEARLIEIACGPVPKGHSRWTLRLLAEQLKVELDEPFGKDAISKALKKTGLSLTNQTTGACQPKPMPNS